MANGDGMMGQAIYKWTLALLVSSIGHIAMAAWGYCYAKENDVRIMLVIAAVLAVSSHTSVIEAHASLPRKGNK